MQANKKQSRSIIENGGSNRTEELLQGVLQSKKGKSYVQTAGKKTFVKTGESNYTIKTRNESQKSLKTVSVDVTP